MAEQKKRYYAGRPFQYTEELDLDAGQVITLVGAMRDEQLVRLGHFREVMGKPVLSECGVCHELFMDDNYRTKHGNKRHPGQRDPIQTLPGGLSSLQTQAIVQEAMPGMMEPDPVDDPRWDRENPLTLANSKANRA